MSDIISINKIKKMMEYLGIHSYIVSYYNLPLPMEAEGENYRPEKIFRLYPNGMMSYKGYHYQFGGVLKSDVHKFDIRPSKAFLARAYIDLCSEVRKKISSQSKFNAMLFYRDLVLKFNELEFLDGENAIEQ